MDAAQALNGCSDCTDWDVFFDVSSTFDEAIDAVTSYITFCTDMLVPVKGVKVYPNNKPRIAPEIAAIPKQTGDAQISQGIQQE